MSKVDFHMCDGDCVGIITPSSPMFPGRLEQGIKFIEDCGFKAKVGKHVDDTNQFLAGRDEDRAQDIMDFYYDNDVKLIMASGGGYGSQRLLPLLDHDFIRNNPKPIVGFSDTTAIQVGLAQSAALVSYSGFVFNCLDLDDGELNPLLSESLLACLKGLPFALSEGDCVHPGVAKGRLLGGNLDCFLALLGTQYQPDFTDSILLIEEVRTEPYKIDSKLSQLSLAGVFDQVSGVIFGEFKDCEANYFPDRDGSVDDVIGDWCCSISVPCIKNFPYGHVDRRCALPIGAEVRLDASKCCVSFNADSP